MIRLFLCRIGWHSWEDIFPLINVRHCKHCGRLERLEFYSNKTEDWVEIKQWEG